LWCVGSSAPRSRIGRYNADDLVDLARAGTQRVDYGGRVQLYVGKKPIGRLCRQVEDPPHMQNVCDIMPTLVIPGCTDGETGGARPNMATLTIPAYKDDRKQSSYVPRTADAQLKLFARKNSSSHVYYELVMHMRDVAHIIASE
jgi:hypothetical protein